MCNCYIDNNKKMFSLIYINEMSFYLQLISKIIGPISIKVRYINMCRYKWILRNSEGVLSSFNPYKLFVIIEWLILEFHYEN